MTRSTEVSRGRQSHANPPPSPAEAVRCESESPEKSLFCVIVGVKQLVLTGKKLVWMLGGKKSELLPCARGKVALMRGCAQVWALPATARFPRAAFVVLMAEKGKKKNHFNIQKCDLTRQRSSLPYRRDSSLFPLSFFPQISVNIAALCHTFGPLQGDLNGSSTPMSLKRQSPASLSDCRL